MADFLRDLLIAEDHAAPYEWAAVALAHGMIGVFLMTCAATVAAAVFGDSIMGLVLVAVGYAVWETMQAASGGPLLDGLLDWLCVMLGASALAAAWERRPALGLAALLAMFGTILAGVSQRIRRR